MFRAGMIIILVGVICELFLTAAIGAVGGQEVLNVVINTALYSYLSVVLGSGVLAPLGVGLVVLSVLARQIEMGSADVDDEDPRLPPTLSPRAAVITGSVMVVIGVVLQVELFGWFQEVKQGLVRDFLTFIAGPLRDEILLAGVLLIACSAVIQMITVNRGGQPAAARVP
jgi:hypothetical protein